MTDGNFAATGSQSHRQSRRSATTLVIRLRGAHMRSLETCGCHTMDCTFDPPPLAEAAEAIQRSVELLEN